MDNPVFQREYSNSFENKYSNQEILRELYLFHLNALLSDKGREYLKERITKNKYEND